MGNSSSCTIGAICVGLTALFSGQIEKRNENQNVQKLNAHQINAVHYFPDTQSIFCACSDGTLRLVEIPNGNEKAIELRYQSVQCLAILDRPHEIAVGDIGGEINILDIKRRVRVFSLKGHSGSISSLACLDDATLASASTDGTLRLWDLNKRKESKTLIEQRSAIMALATSADKSMLASADADGKVMIWRKPFEKPFVTVETHGKITWALAFCLNDQTLISTGGDSIVRMWDLKTKKCSFELSGHHGPVISVAVSSDGKHFATGSSRDKAIIIWDIKSGEKLAKFDLSDYPSALTFSPNGKTLVTGTRGPSLTFFATDTWKKSNNLNLSYRRQSFESE